MQSRGSCGEGVNTMKATALLVRQHRKIEQLIDALTSNEPEAAPERRATLLALVDELIAHMAVEQRVFYPCAQRALDEDLTRNRDTHRRARATLLRLADPLVDDAGFADEVARLKAIVEEHVALEERALFVAIEQIADPYALESLGDRIHAFHSAILRSSAPLGPAKASPPSIEAASRFS
jgi:hemerythrin-like domain-containing protein